MRESPVTDNSFILFHWARDRLCVLNQMSQFLMTWNSCKRAHVQICFISSCKWWTVSGSVLDVGAFSVCCGPVEYRLPGNTDFGGWDVDYSLSQLHQMASRERETQPHAAFPPRRLGSEVSEITGHTVSLAFNIPLHKPPLAKQNPLSEDDTKHQPAGHLPPPPPFSSSFLHCSGGNASLSFTLACLRPCWRQGDKSNTRETFL